MSDKNLSEALFKPGEIARIISAKDMGNKIRLDHSEYGLAIVLDKHRNIVEHLRIGDPPRNLNDDEYVLIATTESVHVNYLSGVPDPKTKHEFGIGIDPFYERNRDGSVGKAVRCRVGFLFRIARNNRNIAQTIHRIMRDEKTNRMSKKDFLANQGRRFSDNIHHIVQTFLNAHSVAALESYGGRGMLDKDARGTLEKRLNDEGLEYIELLAHPRHETEPQGNSAQDRQKQYSGAGPNLHETEPKGNLAQDRQKQYSGAGPNLYETEPQGNSAQTQQQYYDDDSDLHDKIVKVGIGLVFVVFGIVLPIVLGLMGEWLWYFIAIVTTVVLAIALMEFFLDDDFEELQASAVGAHIFYTIMTLTLLGLMGEWWWFAGALAIAVVLLWPVVYIVPITGLVLSWILTFTAWIAPVVRYIVGWIFVFLATGVLWIAEGVLWIAGSIVAWVGSIRKKEKDIYQYPSPTQSKRNRWLALGLGTGIIAIIIIATLLIVLLPTNTSTSPSVTPMDTNGQDDIPTTAPVVQSLSDIAAPNCGGAGEPDCSTGRIYVVNKWSQLVNSRPSHNLAYDKPGTTNPFVIKNTFLNLGYVGDGNNLYASFRDEDESATGEARYRNMILPDSDTLVVVVEDNDASTDGYVVVAVNSSSDLTSYLRLYETADGSGVFIGEVKLVANTSANREEYSIYVDATTVGSINIDGTEEPRVRVVDGEQTQILLPVRNGDDVTFHYRDKTGESNGHDRITTRSSVATVEIDAPIVTVAAPENSSSSTGFTFDGSVIDSGGSGLQVSSLRLEIDGDYSDSDNNIPIIDLRAAITDGYFTRRLRDGNTERDGKDRILIGAENSSSFFGLYEPNSNYKDGRVDVLFSYTLGISLFPRRFRADIDNIVDFQALVYDLAGNVGISDADDIDNGASSEVGDDFQAHTIYIKTKSPGLVDTFEDGFTDIRVGTTDVCLTGSTQSGLVWDNADQHLESNDRFIMVVFDEPVYDISPEDFNVTVFMTSSTGVTAPMVIRVSVASNADADDPFFTSAIRNGELTQGEVDRIIELLGRSVFLELNTTFDPETRLPGVAVYDVYDFIGNAIDPERNSESLFKVCDV